VGTSRKDLLASLAKLLCACTLCMVTATSGVAAETSQTQKARTGNNPNKAMLQSEMVVTTTRMPEKLSNMQSYVTVIGPKELAASPTQSIDDVLRSQAGLDFWGSDIAYGGFRSVTLRGMGGSNDQGRTLILVDGLPINDTWDGNVAWSQVAKEDVERIEIVRGPASALYGGNAMGGVINIITKTPAHKPVGLTAKAAYGSLQRFIGYGNVSGRVLNNKFGYYFSGRKDQNSGYRAVAGEDTPYESKTDRDIYNLMGKLYYYPDDISSINLTAAYFHEKRNRGYIYSNTNPRKVHRINATYRRNNPTGLSMLASVFYQKNDQTTEFDNSSARGRTPAHAIQTGVENYDKPFWGMIFQPSYALTDWNTLTAGVEFKHSELEHHRTSFSSSGDTYQNTLGKQEYFGLYMQNVSSLFNDKLILNLGARMDWWKNFDGAVNETDPDNPLDKTYPTKDWDSFNPKLGLAFHATPALTLRGAAGTGYRAPTPARMYTNLRRGNRIIEGNPDLDPERVVSYELGADYQLRNWATFHLTGYHSEVKDLISSRTIIPGSLQMYDNIGEVEIQGVEAAAVFKLHKFWNGFINFTYNRSEIKKDEETPSNEGNLLEHSPEIKFNVGLTFDRPKWFRATVQGRYVDGMYNDNENTEHLDSYWTMDIKVSRKFFDMLTLDLTVENVFDVRYDWQCYTTIYEAPGALYMVSLTYDF
jgi:outer membrane receptor for ferrienterochelin and colicin